MKGFLVILFAWFVVTALYAEILDVNDPRYAWMDEVIEREFAAYKGGITRDMLDRTQKSDKTFRSFKVVKSRVYAPESGLKETLEEIIRRYPLPDVEFLYLFGGDGITKEFPFPGPLFASAKRRDLRNVISYEWWLVSAASWKRLSEKIEQYSEELPWDLKMNKMFWRGKPSDIRYDKKKWREIPRITLCILSQEHPDLLDAGLVTTIPRNLILDPLVQTGINFVKPFETEYEHMRYKYQVCLDGNTCTYPGFEWRLLSNCVVFKQNSKDEVWYYSQLKPWVHYIPIDQHLSDLFEKMEWARTHDEEARIIAENGQRFMRENVSPDQIYLYCYKVLLKYAKLQKFKPQPGHSYN